MIKAIIFDLDGTILNTLTDLNKALNYALAKVGFSNVTLEETRSFLGNGIKSLVLAGLKGNIEKLDEAYQAFQWYYKRHISDYSKPYSGIVELLNKLKEKNIKLAVLSNKQEKFLKQLVSIHFPDLFLKVIGDKPNQKRKPNPDSLIKLMDSLKVNPSEVIYIGDSEVDVETTINAKISGVFVSYGFRNKKDLEKIANVKICENVCELEMYLLSKLENDKLSTSKHILGLNELEDN